MLPVSSEILIVGAGPTGLVLAYELARRGLAFRLIDQNLGPAAQSRALVVQVRTLEIFHFMGIIDEVLKRGQTIDQINLFTQKRVVFEARFQGLKSPYPFPLVLPQNDTEEILLTALRKKGIEVERETELIEFKQDLQGVDIILRKNKQEEKVRCHWLIGCDGAHSVVRHGLNLPFKGAAYPQFFSLADVDLKSNLNPNELSLFFERDGFFAVFPMRKGWVRLLAVDPQGKIRKPGEEPTIEEFQAWADHFIPGKTKIQKTYWMSDFRLHHRGVSHYQEGRVFVAGDAAHLHSPAGGQGMNTGIQDSFNLAWKLALVVENKISPEVLKTYSQERQPIGAQVLRSTDRFFSVMVSKSFAARFIRSFIFPFVAKVILPKLFKKMAYFVSQLQVNYRKSSIVSEEMGQSWHASAPRPGERAPDGKILDSTQREINLFDLFREVKHLLLIFGEPPKDFLQSLGELNEEFEEIFSSVNVLPGALYGSYGIEKEGIYLIRPDRYVAYRQQSLSLSALRAYLQKTFSCSK